MDLSPADLPINQPLSGIAMHAFLALAAESRPEKIPLAIARATTHALLSDLCYLISAPENGKVTIFDGFNRVKEEILSGMVLQTDHFPELQRCFDEKIPDSQNQVEDLSEDSKDCLLMLGQVRLAPYCFAPIITHDGQLLGGLFLLSPYSGREWNDNDKDQLLALADSAGKILSRVLDTVDLQDQLKSYEGIPQPTPEAAQAWVVEETGETVPTTEAPPVREDSLPQTRTAIFTRSASGMGDLYQAENSLLLDYIAQLRDQLQDLMNSTTIAAEDQKDDGARAALNKVHEELHGMLTPLSAITGYHDLLISESMGNLTAMQQRFLDRIRSAAEKLHHTIDEIEQVAASGIADETLPVVPSVTALDKVVEQSFRSFQQLIQERKLEIRILSPNDLPRVQGAYQEIEPIVHKVLNSLLSITPYGSNIESKLVMQVELTGKRSVLWKATTHAQSMDVPIKELDEFSEYLQENVFSLAERLDCQLWMDAAVHTERQINLLFPSE